MQKLNFSAKDFMENDPMLAITYMDRTTTCFAWLSVLCLVDLYLGNNILQIYFIPGTEKQAVYLVMEC